MAKPVKRSVALVVYQDTTRRDGPVLAVRRPPDDPDLPDIWGLPAASLRSSETWEAAASRVGQEKLGVLLEPLAELLDGTTKRPGYLLRMKLYGARLTRGEPAVPQRDPNVTQYTAWKWARPVELLEGARRGSLCCRLYLEMLNESGS